MCDMVIEYDMYKIYVQPDINLKKTEISIKMYLVMTFGDLWWIRGHRSRDQWGNHSSKILEWVDLILLT